MSNNLNWDRELSDVGDYIKNPGNVVELSIMSPGGSVVEFSKKYPNKEVAADELSDNLGLLKKRENVRLAEEDGIFVRGNLRYGDKSIDILNIYSLSEIVGGVALLMRGANPVNQYAKQDKNAIAVITSSQVLPYQSA